MTETSHPKASKSSSRRSKTAKSHLPLTLKVTLKRQHHRVKMTKEMGVRRVKRIRIRTLTRIKMQMMLMTIRRKRRLLLAIWIESKRSYSRPMVIQNGTDGVAS